MVDRRRGQFLSSDLRWLFAHQLLDAAAKMPRVIATGWLVLEVADSPFWVGAIFGIEGIMLLSFGGLGGVIAARVDRRLILATVHGVFAVVMIAVAVLSAVGMPLLWHLIAAAALAGVGRCLHIPLSTGMLLRAVERGQFQRALGGRSLMFNIGKMVGSAIIGVIIAKFGFTLAFLFLAAVQVAAGVVLTRLSSELGRITLGARSRPMFPDLVRQFRYTLRVARVRALFMMSILMELFVYSFNALLPVLARDVLGVGAGALGVLSAAGSLGAILCGLVITAAGEVQRRGLLTMLACLFSGAALIGYAASRWFLLSVVIAVGVGVAGMIYDVMIFTLAQATVPSARRDQSTGLLAQTFGFNPIGSTLAGILTQVAGMPAALILSGGVIVVYALSVLAPKRHLWDRPRPLLDVEGTPESSTHSRM